MGTQLLWVRSGARLLSLLAILICLMGFASPALGQYATFPDPRLSLIVGNKVLSEYEPGDLIPLDRVQAMEELWAPSPYPSTNAIRSIAGLEQATSLRQLSLGMNQISDLAPIAGLSQLTDLHLQWNLINDLAPLGGLTHLESLSLGWNPISDLTPLEELTALVTLSVGQSTLTNIDSLGSLHNLQNLYMDNAGLSTLVPLGGLVELRRLGLSGNSIADLSPLQHMTHLTWLRINGNPLNAEAYSIYIPLIEANNPGIEILYDPIPEPTVCTVLAAAALLSIRRRRFNQ